MSSLSEILDEIENLVVEAKHVPFTNKCVIEDDDIVRLIDDLRSAIPQEIQAANQVLREQEQIVQSAKQEANKIVNQAKEFAAKLTEEHEIVKQAEAQARAMLQKSTAEADEVRDGSLKYADQVFAHLITNVTKALDVLSKAQEGLNQMKQGEKREG